MRDGPLPARRPRAHPPRKSPSRASLTSRKDLPNQRSITLDGRLGREQNTPIMRRPLALVLAVGFSAATLAAQSPQAAKPQGTAWKMPRTPDGHPDFQGVWSNNSVTPM